ncbi:hypothetical protein SSX86_027367 [Deinandra increscens subsp. villosa]|uniref:Uncharacterized protein n=1 Tax=Deinandra increscens subsp. villosa TaxID=3103831 RepID=A0AAP0GPX5_9ASTR
MLYVYRQRLGKAKDRSKNVEYFRATRSSSVNARQLSTQLISRFFKFLPWLLGFAVDAHLDLCEAEELGVVNAGYIWQAWSFSRIGEADISKYLKGAPSRTGIDARQNKFRSKIPFGGVKMSGCSLFVLFCSCEQRFVAQEVCYALRTNANCCTHRT